MTALLFLAVVVPVSGADFLNPETRALQDDPFANPGFLWVERGAALWTGEGCPRCHALADVRPAAFPRYDEATRALVNLEGRINRCRALACGGALDIRERAAPGPYRVPPEPGARGTRSHRIHTRARNRSGRPAKPSSASAAASSTSLAPTAMTAWPDCACGANA